VAQGHGIDQPRYARWVSVSHAIDAIEPGLPVLIQGLGKIDARLVHGDAAFRSLPQEQRGTWQESIKLTDRFALSHLWVLGVYEIVRTLSDRVRKNAHILPLRLRQRITRTKRLFARLRIPLAKLEPADAFPTDYPLARPSMHRVLGIAWKVADRSFIPRRRLSDRLLSLMAAIQRIVGHAI